MKLCTGDFLRHRLNDCECMTIHSGAIIVEHETRAMYYIAMMLNQFIKATKSRMASSKVSFASFSSLFGYIIIYKSH